MIEDIIDSARKLKEALASEVLDLEADLRDTPANSADFAWLREHHETLKLAHDRMRTVLSALATIDIE